mmetsp:Transcript_8897/g.15970  ORF Transcript_8897/g.15970 Transcript_8897/m.15970 type:complete len:199 (+) Transcript_8897:158-754(+)
MQQCMQPSPPPSMPLQSCPYSKQGIIEIMIPSTNKYVGSLGVIQAQKAAEAQAEYLPAAAGALAGAAGAIGGGLLGHLPGAMNGWSAGFAAGYGVVDEAVKHAMVENVLLPMHGVQDSICSKCGRLFKTTQKQGTYAFTKCVACRLAPGPCMLHRAHGGWEHGAIVEVQPAQVLVQYGTGEMRTMDHASAAERIQQYI